MKTLRLIFIAIKNTLKTNDKSKLNNLQAQFIIS